MVTVVEGSAVADALGSMHGFPAALTSFVGRAAAANGVPVIYCTAGLRGKGLAGKPGRSRRYHIPPEAARTITALLALREHVIGPILGGVRSPRIGRKPAHWTRIDRRYESLRTGMQDLFHDLGIATAA